MTFTQRQQIVLEMQMALLTLTITAHSGNEQAVTILCVYVTANWNYFCILKGCQVLLSS